MEFKIALEEERVRRGHIVTLHLIVVFALIITGAFLLIIQYMLNSLDGAGRASLTPLTIPAGLGAGVLAGGLLLLGLTIFKSNLLLERGPGRVIRISELLLMGAFAGLSFWKGLQIPGIIYTIISLSVLYALISEGRADSTLYVVADKKGIRLPVTSRKKFLQWWEVENVLVRFSILTIDCHDNRLFQWNISDRNFDRESFQRFCGEKIAESRELRKKHVW